MPCTDYLGGRCKPRDQQAAYQPSGNGTSGHAIWLSLAASGGSSMVCGWAKKSSCGAGAMAVLTASSNWSNSTSLITRSPGFESARCQKSFVSRLNKQLKLYRSGDRGPRGYRCPNFPGRILGGSTRDQM